MPSRSSSSRKPSRATTILHDVAVFVYRRSEPGADVRIYDLIVTRASGKAAGAVMARFEIVGTLNSTLRGRELGREYAAAGHRRVDVQDDQGDSLGVYYAPGVARDS